MKILLFFAAVLLSLSTVAQKDSDKEKKITINIHGFIKSDYWYDTRQVAYAREGLFTLFPKDVKKDAAGKDLNAAASFNYSAITSRINFLIEGPEAFGAKTSGFVEADFSGVSNITINTFRLRHAYLKLQWPKTELLLGQFWHPDFVTDVFPTVLSLNTGAPFQPFIRSPQIRLTLKKKAFNFVFTALSQRDYSNYGPLGRSPVYLSNSLIPNLNAQIRFHKGIHYAGAGIDWKTLRPRLVSDSNLISKEKVSGVSFMTYYALKTKKFDWKSKAILGENLTDHLLLGGYAVAAIDSANDFRSYTPTRHFFLWTNFIFHKSFGKTSIHPGLFLGYAQNLGTAEENTGIYYTTGSNIDRMYRISPAFSIKSQNTMFSLEWEMTTAYYGSLNKSGLVTDTHAVTNHRFLFTGFYFF